MITSHQNSHNKTKHETLPLTAGHRLGLAYDLRLDTHAGKALVHDLLDRLNDAENNLFYNVACCAEEVETQVRENHPLLFVLEKTYEPGAMAVRYLGAADRARVLGVMNVAREVYGGEGGWRLRGYLAAVTREVKILERTGGVGDGLHKYVVDRVVGLEGEVMDEVKETVVVEGRCVLQPEEFESDERRWPDGKTTVSGRSRTVSALRDKCVRGSGCVDALLTRVGSASCLVWKGKRLSSLLAASSTCVTAQGFVCWATCRSSAGLARAVF